MNLIKTKYNIGDNVYLIVKRYVSYEIVKSKIRSISIESKSINHSELNINYIIEGEGEVEEKDIYVNLKKVKEEAVIKQNKINKNYIDRINRFNGKKNSAVDDVLKTFGGRIS